MGLDINEANIQSTSTINQQSSQENCINANIATENVQISAVSSLIEGNNFSNVIMNNNSSCNLKASLQSAITNKLASKQKSTQFDVPGPFTILSDLLGGGDSINETNRQTISNEVTQAMNSLCQNNNTAPKVVDLVVNNTKLINNDFSNYIKSNKTQCIIDNMSSFYAQNSEANTQTATQVRIGAIVFIVLIIVAGSVAVAIVKYGFKGKSAAQQDSSKDDDTTTTTTTTSPALPKPVSTLKNPASNVAMTRF